MATIAIGDVHGNLSALSDLLDQLRPELGADDVVVFLGDYIDRGPESKGCIDAILASDRRNRYDRAWCPDGMRFPDRRVYQSARHAERELD